MEHHHERKFEIGPLSHASALQLPAYIFKKQGKKGKHF